MSGSPSIVASNVTSTRPDGAYQAGDVIDVVVTLASAVTWSKQRPVIGMYAQQATRDETTAVGEALFIDGNGTATWRFEYRVRAGVNVTDLSTASSMTKGQGTFTKVSDVSDVGNITLPTGVGALSDNKAITANTTALTTVTATSIGVDLATGSYDVSTIHNFTVVWPEAITAMDCDTAAELELAILDASNNLKYTPRYISGSGTNTWVFSGVSGGGVPDSIPAAPGINAWGSAMHGTGFRRADGSYCSVALPADGQAGAFSTSKTIAFTLAVISPDGGTASTSLTSGAYQAGQVVDIALAFGGSHTLGAGPNPTIMVLDGPSGRPIGEATYVSGSGTATWHFTFTIPTGVEITQLSLDDLVLLGSNTLRLTALLITSSKTFGKIITATTKAVSTLVSTALADAVYDPLTNIDIVATLPFATTIAGGTPSLPLCNADGTSLGVSATYLSGSGTTSWTFRYTADVGVTTADLRTGILAANGASFTKTSGGSAVTVQIRDQWIGTLFADHEIGLSGLASGTTTAGFFLL